MNVPEMQAALRECYSAARTTVAVGLDRPTAEESGPDYERTLIWINDRLQKLTDEDMGYEVTTEKGV